MQYMKGCYREVLGLYIKYDIFLKGMCTGSPYYLQYKKASLIVLILLA